MVITFGFLKKPSKFNCNEVRLEQFGYRKLLGIRLDKKLNYLEQLLFTKKSSSIS